MITKDELSTIAQLKGLNSKNAEKDYLLDLSLHSLSKFGDTLILKGGTALYKFYNLNRFSEDLDFTQNKRRINLEKLLHTILHNTSLLSISGTIEEKQRFKNEINVRLSFRGPLYDGNKASMTRITINISSRERPQHIKKEFLIPVYKEIPSFEIFVLEAKEILAEKIRAIMTRDKPRDVYDLWFLSKRGIQIDKTLIDKKLRIYKIHFDRKELFEKIEIKRGAWERDLRGLLIGSPPNFAEVIQDLQRFFTSDRLSFEGFLR